VAAVDRSWSQLRLTKALVDPLEGELRELRRAVERFTADGGSDGRLERELAELRRATSELVQRGLAGAGERRDPCAERLLVSGLRARHATALAEEATRADVGVAASAEEALRQVLAKRLDSRLVPPREDDGARVTLLVGPTGVGKTTTLAKLAAREVQRGSGSVSLLSTDSFRVGAEEQLRIFAQLLRVPFGVAVSADDLLARVQGTGARRVLVDTAGHSRRDPEPIQELCRFRERLPEPMRVHLVLSATTKEGDLVREVERYRWLEPDSLVVTKLDESADVGNVASLLLDETTPPLAWFGTGQRVPEDLEVPDPGEFADCILGGAP
jgi:flagellar biosynthesis protein FlhF